MSEKIKFGIIGFGFMGQTHGNTLRNLEYAELVAVSDIDESTFEYAENNEKTYLDANDLLADDDINTIIIATPNQTHLHYVELAAKAGKNIICEKPLAMNGKEVEKMIEVTEKHGVLFTVHHQRRWDKDYQIAREIVNSNELGEIYTIKSSIYGFNGNMHDWHIYPEFGGGMLYDWGVHLIDQVINMVPAKLNQVYAHVKNVINDDVDDYFNLQLYFENGINAQIELGTYFLSDKNGWFERHWFLGGNKASATIDGFDPKGSIVSTSELLTNVPGQITMTAAGPTRSFGPPPEGRIISKPLPEVETSHKLFFDNYYKTIIGEEELAIKPSEILRLMNLLDTIRISASKHKSLDFEV